MRPLQPTILLRDVGRTFGSGDTAVHALHDVSLAVRSGDFVAVMGPSGSGKSTLMNILGCLEIPDRGRYFLDGVDVRGLSESQQAVIRSKKIGFVFQGFNLIARTPALENVELPLIYAGVSRRERRRRASAALEAVGLGDRIHHQPSELSGGQQQRVAIARAIVNDPSLLLADEPTGALDSASTESVLDLFADLNDQGRTVVIITHEDEVGARTKRMVNFRDGALVGDERQAPLGRPLRAVAPPLAVAA